MQGLISYAAAISFASMIQSIKQAALLCYRAGDHLVDNYGMEMAGYLTFLALLSIFPYLVLTVSAMGVIGQGELGSHYIAILLEHLPADAVKMLRPRIEEIISGPPQSILTFSILGAIWTSSSAIEGIRGMLNRAYRVHKPPAYLRRRLTSIGQIMMLTVLLLSILLLLVLVPIIVKTFTYYTGIEVPLALDELFEHYFSVIAVLALFGMVATFYHVLPNIKQSWFAVLPGSFLVVALWYAGAATVSFYLQDINDVTLIYGSLSGFIATLIFFYVMNVIFIYGAEFNHELMVVCGKKIIEKEAPAGETIH